MSPETSIQKKTSEAAESSLGLSTEGKRTPSTLTALILSGPNSPPSIARSSGSPDPTPETSGEETLRNEPQIISQGPESPWTSISPSTEENHSTAPTLPPSKSESWPTQEGYYGIRPQDEDYSTFVPKLLMNKAPWSTPSPILYGRSAQQTAEPTIRFLYGYTGTADPRPMPNSPPQYRMRGAYQGRGMSWLLAGGDHEMEAGGSGMPSNPTDAERLEQACILYDQMCQKADRLEQEIEILKGKKPGRDPL